jgi:hypothetical protein
MDSSHSPRILLAVAPPAVQTFLANLKPHFPVAVCTSMGAVRVALNEPFDLVLTSPHFDASRMFDLLRHASHVSSGVPVLCLSSYEIENIGADLELLKWAANAYGAKGYVDMARWTQLYGKTTAFALLCAVIHGVANKRTGSIPTAAAD